MKVKHVAYETDLQNKKAPMLLFMRADYDGKRNSTHIIPVVDIGEGPQPLYSFEQSQLLNIDDKFLTPVQLKEKNAAKLVIKQYGSEHFGLGIDKKPYTYDEVKNIPGLEHISEEHLKNPHIQNKIDRDLFGTMAWQNRVWNLKNPASKAGKTFYQAFNDRVENTPYFDSYDTNVVPLETFAKVRQAAPATVQQSDFRKNPGHALGWGSDGSYTPPKGYTPSDPTEGK